MSECKSKCCEEITSVVEDVRAIRDALVGTVEKPGLAERVRLLEGSERKRVWLQRTFIVVLATLIAEKIKAVFR